MFLFLSKINKLTIFIFIFTITNTNFLHAQKEKSDIIIAYENYMAAPREVVYVQLNKSTYIKGENIGFTAYVLDKKSKKRSIITTNLFITIEDENKMVINEKMLKVNNGISSNVFEIDSSFTSGYYTIKAYTNWMLNFDEQNYFIETIRVIDPIVEQYLETGFVETNLDAQFLPESGHLVNQINNTVGVILKDAKGYGLPNAKGKVYDKNNTLVSEFKVNHLGIGKFILLAEYDNTYTIKVDYLNKIYSFNLNNNVENTGITLSLIESRNKAFVKITTNSETLKLLNNKNYKLTLHNGHAINETQVIFTNTTSITKSYSLNEIATGINIFTLFNENNQPIAERLFFNYNGLKQVKSQNLTATTINDSISLKFKLDALNTDKFNTLSISILPADTKSHNRHNNIWSYSLLQPYIKGPIEDAMYYFKEINNRTKFDLDNLLLTQGWSSYNWDKIVNNPPILDFAFEQGISLKANTNTENVKSDETYMLSSSKNEGSYIFKINKGQKSFLAKGMFITEKDNIYISKINLNGSLGSPRLYLQASPNSIPKLEESSTILRPKNKTETIEVTNGNKYKTATQQNSHQLNEVIITTKINKERVRAQELKRGRFGTIHVVTKEVRDSFYFLEDYIRTLGVVVLVPEGIGENRSAGRGEILFLTNRQPSQPYMDVFLDDLWIGKNFQTRWPMSNVDYVEINKSGIDGKGGGLRGSGGTIKIYTNPEINDKKNIFDTGKTYDIGLKFASNKKFYIPKYKSYKNDFYNFYGTIAWKPDIKVNEDGNFSFKISKPEVPFILFIEGIINDDSYFYEEKKIF